MTRNLARKQAIAMVAMLLLAGCNQDMGNENRARRAPDMNTAVAVPPAEVPAAPQAPSEPAPFEMAAEPAAAPAEVPAGRRAPSENPGAAPVADALAQAPMEVAGEKPDPAVEKKDFDYPLLGSVPEQPLSAERRAAIQSDYQAEVADLKLDAAPSVPVASAAPLDAMEAPRTPVEQAEAQPLPETIQNPETEEKGWFANLFDSNVQKAQMAPEPAETASTPVVATQEFTPPPPPSPAPLSEPPMALTPPAPELMQASAPQQLMEPAPVPSAPAEIASVPPVPGSEPLVLAPPPAEPMQLTPPPAASIYPETSRALPESRYAARRAALRAQHGTVAN